VADIDATLKQQVFYLPQRERITDIHHHREADYLGRTVEITEGVFASQEAEECHTQAQADLV
jgi:hypothetical protein